MKIPNAVTAGRIGRILRVGIGVFLIISIALVYIRVDWRLILPSVGIALGLTVFYGLVHFAVVNYVTGLSPWLGAVLANLPLILVYGLGSGSTPIFGQGKGQLGAALFLGVSLLLAGFRGDPGCEVMVIPNIWFREPTHLACLLFSPVDWLEGKLQKR